MRLPSLEVSQTTTSQGQYPALLLKMETLPKDSNGSSCFTYMTSPISLAEPKPADIKLSKELEEALKPHGCFESQEELNHRFEVLGHLDALVKTWVKDLSMLKNMPESVAETVRRPFLFQSVLLSLSYFLLLCLSILLIVCFRSVEKSTPSAPTVLVSIIGGLILTPCVWCPNILTEVTTLRRSWGICGSCQKSPIFEQSKKHSYLW